jgi:hypothetical protein
MSRIKERFARLTTRKMVSTLDWSGISTISSGTTVVSIAAAQAVSGAVILTSPYMYSNAYVGSAGNIERMVTIPISVGGGAFLIITAGSLAVTAPMPVAWSIINQSK